MFIKRDIIKISDIPALKGKQVIFTCRVHSDIKVKSKGAQELKKKTRCQFFLLGQQVKDYLHSRVTLLKKSRSCDL